jgi:hypothetical protein
MRRQTHNPVGLFRSAAVMGSIAVIWLTPVMALSPSDRNPVEQIAALAQGSPMVAVSEGYFLIGTAPASDGSFSLATQYDDTEQPQPLWPSSYGGKRRRVG